jgi:hypothetical protein
VTSIVFMGVTRDLWIFKLTNLMYGAKILDSTGTDLEEIGNKLRLCAGIRQRAGRREFCEADQFR